MEEINEEHSDPTFEELFYSWRKASGLSHAEIARAVDIPLPIVEMLEKGNCRAFPAYSYAAGYMNRIIHHYAIANGDKLNSALRAQWQEKQPLASHALIPQSKKQQWYITPRRLMSVLGGVALIFFIWLLSSQLIGFTAAPSLHIDEPSREAITNTPMIRVRGMTEKESQLTVNGREITMDKNGTFNEEIELIPGLNELHFLAQNRFGKVTEDIRYVVVQ